MAEDKVILPHILTFFGKRIQLSKFYTTGNQQYNNNLLNNWYYSQHMSFSTAQQGRYYRERTRAYWLLLSVHAMHLPLQVKPELSVREVLHCQVPR